MLTKEEFEKIKRDIKYIYPEWTFTSLMDILQNHVEKSDPPKRAIQVGDIYLNDKDEICQIDEVSQYSTDVRGMGMYSKSGRPDRGYKRHLNLSKRYKLVEVEDDV